MSGVNANSITSKNGVVFKIKQQLKRTTCEIYAAKCKICSNH